MRKITPLTTTLSLLDLSQTPIAERVLTIQRRAYRIEADLIGFDGIPQLHETLAQLQASDEHFLGYWKEKTLAGVLSYSIEADTLDIGRLVVHPDYFRQGIARKLLQKVETTPNIKRIIVSTGARNTPACTLYETSGYTLVEKRTVVEGLTIALFENSLSS